MTAAAPTTLQFSTHFIDPGNGVQNKLIAADGAGNFFIVSTISSGTNKSTVHVTKTDGAGNALAAFDFGGSGLTTPASAAVDASSDLLIGGSSGADCFRCRRLAARQPVSRSSRSWTLGLRKFFTQPGSAHRILTTALPALRST